MNKTKKGFLFIFLLFSSCVVLGQIYPEGDESFVVSLLLFFGIMAIMEIVDRVLIKAGPQNQYDEEERKETKKPSITAEEERKKPKRAPPPPCKACGSRNIETSPIGEIGTSSFRPGVHLTCRDCGWQITYRG